MWDASPSPPALGGWRPTEEQVARIIEPDEFRRWDNLRAYCLSKGDSEAEATACADQMHPKDKALAKAAEILALAPAQSETPEHVEPAPDMLDGIKPDEWWMNLECADQKALAERIAANVGYELTPEPSLSLLPEPSAPTCKDGLQVPEPSAEPDKVALDAMAERLRVLITEKSKRRGYFPTLRSCLAWVNALSALHSKPAGRE
jgi:hypothetical protein